MYGTVEVMGSGGALCDGERWVVVQTVMGLEEGSGRWSGGGFGD